MGTHKVYLTAEQWARLCSADAEVAAEVALQQPELYANFAATAKEPAKETSTDHDSDDSPVCDKNVPEAVQQISRMLSKDKLQHIIDSDQRSTVQEAARKRLAVIEGT